MEPVLSPRPAATSWSRSLALALGTLLLLACWLMGLGAAPLADVDEGAFAEASREMLASGDWGHTTLNGADRFDKPPLVYWLQASTLALFGPHEWVVRLPSALCAWLQGLVLAAFAWRRWGDTAAVLVAVMAATVLGLAVIGRAATADALLNLLIVAAALDLWRFIESAGTQHAVLRRAGLWIGLGILAKGPVAALVPMAACALLCAWPGLPGRAIGWRRWLDPGAWLLMIGVPLPWYLYALMRHGQAFIDGFIVRHNIERFTGALEGHSGGPWYPLLALPVLLLPWSPLLVGLARQWRLLWQEPLSRFLLGWAAFVLVFFAIAATKLPHYVLYGSAPLLLLMARRLAEGRRADALAVVLCALVVSALLALSPLALPALRASAGEQARVMVDAVLAGASPPLGLAWAGTAIVLGSLWLATSSQAAQRQRAAVLAGLATLLVFNAMLAWWLHGLQGPVRELARAAQEQARPLVQWQLHQPSIGFYMQQPVPRRAPRAGEAALVRLDRFEALPPTARGGCVIVERAGALGLAVCR